jgi:large subunit ribosomal protein L6
MSAVKCCAGCSDERFVTMSRVGKNPVPIPSGVTVEVRAGTVHAKGKLGALALAVPDIVETGVEDGRFWVKPANDTKQARLMWGTVRNSVRNMARASRLSSRSRSPASAIAWCRVHPAQLGYIRHHLPVPADVQIGGERPTAITISGADKQRVGQIAAEIRAFRPPEPYKGKGIRYSDETILRKEGKKK